ncbi:MAG: radical SAM protein [Verrucomicrobiae bacterium]|nr:radical SAM protein [Verrucomicrobiae bacterium]
MAIFTSQQLGVLQDNETLDALRSMANYQFVLGNYSKSLMQICLLLKKNMTDLGGLDLLVRLAITTGNANPLQDHLSSLIEKKLLDSSCLNVILLRFVSEDPSMNLLARRIGLSGDKIADWIAERARPETNLSAIDTSFLKKLMASPVGRSLRRIFPTFEPVCSEFPSANLVILSDGTVTTCCADYAGVNVFAALDYRSLQQVWSEDVARVLERGLYEMPLCRGCIGSQKAPLRTNFEIRNNMINRNSNIDTLTIEMMGACNYGCCVGSSVYKYRKVDTDLRSIFYKIQSILGSIRRLRLFNYGEPLLNKDFVWFINQCRNESSQIHMMTSTNGMLLNEDIAKGMIESNLNHVVVSIHGGPGTENMLRYSKYGANYEKVLSNVARLIKIRDDAKSCYPTIGLRAILFNWNDSDECLEWLRRDAAKLGLEAHWGHSSTNNYHWIHDGDGLGERASARFRPDSDLWHQLVASREFCMPSKYEEDHALQLSSNSSYK